MNSHNTVEKGEAFTGMRAGKHYERMARIFGLNEDFYKRAVGDLRLEDGMKALDMGCGTGALGVTLSKANPGVTLTMADINERAVSLAKDNASRNGVVADTLQSDGFGALLGRVFDLIVTNPPIRAGKAIIYRMFADGARALAPGGALVLVIRKQQGAPSAKTYLQTLFAKVGVIARESGYWIIRCEEPIPGAGQGVQCEESE